jgi:YegS/Rv2252/BmrU family lipid kinase
MKKEALFIVNPISGGKSKLNFLKHLNNFKFKNLKPTILMWNLSEEWKEISEKIINSNYDIYVAVGGDGTVNLVARNLINTNKILGIVPFGSGNGLSRHLGISMNPIKALNRLDSNFETLTIDSGTVNNYNFFCTTGFGFDAVVANAFAQLKSRGLFGYVKTTLQLLGRYVPPTYKIESKDFAYQKQYYIITVANANQFGNNVKIAPKASVNDNLLDLVAIRHSSLTNLILVALKLLSGNVLKSKRVKFKQIEHLTISSEKPFFFHLDGEPMKEIKHAEIKILPHSLIVAI